MFFQFFYVGKESLQKLKTNKQLELQTVVMQFVRYKPMLLETVLYFWSSKIYCKTENCAFGLSLSTWFLLVLLRVSKCRLFGLRYSPQKGIFPLFFYSYLEFWQYPQNPAVTLFEKQGDEKFQAKMYEEASMCYTAAMEEPIMPFIDISIISERLFRKRAGCFLKMVSLSHRSEFSSFIVFGLFLFLNSYKIF